MLGASVVPLGDAARAPAKTASDFKSIDLFVEPMPKWPRLLLAHPIDAGNEISIDEERFSSCLWVRANDRMALGRVRLLRVFHDLVGGVAMAGPFCTKHLFIGVNRLETINLFFQIIGEALVRKLHIGPGSVSAKRWNDPSNEHRTLRRTLPECHI